MEKRWLWSALAMGAGAAAVIAVIQKWRMPLPWSAWLPGLVEQHGKEEGQRLLRQAYADWGALVAEYPRPLPKPPLREHLVGNILPGIALYRVLLGVHGGDRQAALAEIEPLFKTWTNALYGRMVKIFGVLPFSFWFFKLGTKMRLQNFPAEVWNTTWVEDNARRIAFNNLSCPYVNNLRDYGVPELAPLYCQIDDWMGEMLPPGITFRRTQTLARGGPLCDFSYEKTG